MAKLFFRYGAMNSGKTTHLLQVAHNYEERGMQVLVLKPIVDTKAGNQIISRLDVSREVDYLITKNEDVYELISIVFESDKISCVLVDEAQFLTKRQVDQLMKVVTKLDIAVICYGLRTDFKTNSFDGANRLLAIAHTIEEMKTICPCGRKAIFNARKLNGDFVFDGRQVEIDNQDKVEYLSLCAHCYQEEKEEREKNYIFT